MKITRGSLRAIIKEMQEDFVEFGDEKYSRDDLLDMISDYSKELTGRRDRSALQRLQNAPIDQISKHYEDMFDSPEAMEVRAKFEKEDQQKADRAIGMQRDEDPMERMPHRQGMGRRVEAVNSLKALIREMVISENKMLDIITNPYEEVEDYNILANYALNNDIKGALADPELKYYVDNNEMGMLADEAGGWFEQVGSATDLPAPEGWDSQKAYKFLRDLEDAAWKEYSKAMKSRIGSDPDKKWLEFLGNQFTAGIEPGDMEDIKWKQYKKYIRIMPPKSISHGVGEITVNRDQVEGYSDSPGKYEEFIEFLEKRAGGDAGRRPAYKKSPPPYYD